MLSCVQMTLTDSRGSSYIDSICVLVPVMFVACRPRVALIFALLLATMKTITVSKATMLIIKAVARELLDTMYTVLVSVG